MSEGAGPAVNRRAPWLSSMLMGVCRSQKHLAANGNVSEVDVFFCGANCLLDVD